MMQLSHWITEGHKEEDEEYIVFMQQTPFYEASELVFNEVKLKKNFI